MRVLLAAVALVMALETGAAASVMRYELNKSNQAKVSFKF